MSKKSKDKRQVFGYLRVSKREAESAEHTAKTQKTIIENYVKHVLDADAYEFVGFELDDGVSGRVPVLQRPAFNRILARCTPGDVIVVQEHSRFSRKTADGLKTREHLYTELGVHIAGPGFQEWDQSEETNTTAQLLGCTIYSGQQSEKMKGVHQRQMSNGEGCYGRSRICPKKIGEKVVKIKGKLINRPIYEKKETGIPYGWISHMDRHGRMRHWKDDVERRQITKMYRRNKDEGIGIRALVAYIKSHPKAMTTRKTWNYRNLRLAFIALEKDWPQVSPENLDRPRNSSARQERKGFVPLRFANRG